MICHQFLLVLAAQALLHWSLIWAAADSVIVFKKLHAPLGDDDHPHKYDDEDNDHDDADHGDVDIIMGPPESLPLSWALWV